jgi:mono/diheme cytochrome c family protein
VQKAIIHFVISALLGLGIGYLAFQVIGGEDDPNLASPETTETETTNEDSNDQEDTSSDTESVVAEDNLLSAKGCLGCHSVEGLNLTGGATGPDLTQAYINVEGKHGKPIDQFLKEPTSAVMSGVIGGNPLSDDEIAQMVDLLKQASEK